MHANDGNRPAAPAGINSDEEVCRRPALLVGDEQGIVSPHVPNEVVIDVVTNEMLAIALIKLKIPDFDRFRSAWVFAHGLLHFWQSTTARMRALTLGGVRFEVSRKCIGKFTISRMGPRSWMVRALECREHRR